MVSLTPLSENAGSGSRLSILAFNSEYFTSDPLKRNSKNASSAVSVGVTGKS
jgi:hypothetical protein